MVVEMSLCGLELLDFLVLKLFVDRVVALEDDEMVDDQLLLELELELGLELELEPWDEPGK